RPQRAGHEHQVTVALDRDANPSTLLVGERGARRCRRRVADTGATRATIPAIGLIEVPEPTGPGYSDTVADQRPVFILDLSVNLRAHSRRRDRTRVPPDGRVRLCLFAGRLVRLRELLAARLEGGLAVCVDELLDLFGQRRQARFAVARDREVNFVETPEVLVIGLHVEIAAAQRDDLRPRLEIRP